MATLSLVLGLAAVFQGFRQASFWALVAGFGGFLAAAGLALAPLMRVWLSERPLSRPTDFTHIVDLLRRVAPHDVPGSGSGTGAVPIE